MDKNKMKGVYYNGIIISDDIHDKIIFINIDSNLFFVEGPDPVDPNYHGPIEFDIIEANFVRLASPYAPFIRIK